MLSAERVHLYYFLMLRDIISHAVAKLQHPNPSMAISEY